MIGKLFKILPAIPLPQKQKKIMIALNYYTKICLFLTSNCYDWLKFDKLKLQFVSKD